MTDLAVNLTLQFLKGVGRFVDDICQHDHLSSAFNGDAEVGIGGSDQAGLFGHAQHRYDVVAKEQADHGADEGNQEYRADKGEGEQFFKKAFSNDLSFRSQVVVGRHNAAEDHGEDHGDDADQKNPVFDCGG